MRNDRDIYVAIGMIICHAEPGEWDQIVLRFTPWTEPFMNSLSKIHNGKAEVINLLQYDTALKKLMHELHEMTAERNGKKWHSCTYTLTNDGDFSMDFIWD